MTNVIEAISNAAREISSTLDSRGHTVTGLACLDRLRPPPLTQKLQETR